MILAEYTDVENNVWEPPEIRDSDLAAYLSSIQPGESEKRDRLIIFRVKPYIDSLYVQYDDASGKPTIRKRFTFHEDYRWEYEDERFFVDNCLKNLGCDYTYSAIDEIYRYYSECHPDWKLKRYYTRNMKLLDHIYHCMRRGTAKEMLYKAGLDELAVNIEDLDEINLLACKPSEIYAGISMRTLRALNCPDGSTLLATDVNRVFVRELQRKFPDAFGEALNDAQCRYLNRLIAGDLTVDEAGRLFMARRKALMMIWCHSQYEMFIFKETMNERIIAEAKLLEEIDPIYKDYIGNLDRVTRNMDQKLHTLRYYLLHGREEYDKKIRRANRKRNPDWQERDQGYVVRYPQTINDFCREAIYMSNCLLTYVDALVNNDTTILFVRKEDSINRPFITMEIFGDQLMQAYHRFNEDCTEEEGDWIREYCDRHGIERSMEE